MDDKDYDLFIKSFNQRARTVTLVMSKLRVPKNMRFNAAKEALAFVEGKLQGYEFRLARVTYEE